MREPVPFFKAVLQRANLLLAVGVVLASVAGIAIAQEMSVESLPDDYTPKERKQALALDVYRQNIHQEFTHFLRKSETIRHIKRGKLPALDVNDFDEVPDSLFFTNRHGKKKLSGQELKAGPVQGSSGGPRTGEWKVTKGKSGGLSRGMFIEDSGGAKFLLKFDPEDNPEVASGAESVASRTFHAVGYNVPEYYVTYFSRDQLRPAPGAKYYAKSGFKKPLTDEGIDEILSGVPQTRDGRYRASASRLLPGEVLGREEYDRRRKQDPNDPVWHRDRRTFRALRVFASWINYYDLVPQNSLEVVESVDGKRAIRHYIIDFGSSLGSAGNLVKPDMYGFEHMLDYGEVFKSFITLGFYRKPWEKRADEIPQEIPLASVGNFDNKEFHPEKWKTQLPVYAFKELTPADAFWAAKIIMEFSDEDIRTLVETGEYTDKQAVDYLTLTLAERRDMIGRYWFDKVSPLDEIDAAAQGGNLSIRFVDLSETYGFTSAGDTSYRYEVFDVDSDGDKENSLASGMAEQSPISLTQGQWTPSGTNIVEIQAKRSASGEWLPPVTLEISQAQLAGIHRD
ncbi:MAG: hypothetical protein HY587_07885 [Candidatus Omnitrophica bacterium]|nr:hypothetical protein [Candidatus Omnitrophota bacterium]